MDGTRNVIELLEAEYDQSEGFLGQLRAGVLDEQAYERFLDLLRGLELEGEVVSRRVVELLWFVPTFMEYQTWHLEERSGLPADEYGRYKQGVLNLLMDKLGLP